MRQPEKTREAQVAVHGSGVKVLSLLGLTLVIWLLLWGHWLLQGPKFTDWTWHRTAVWPLAGWMALAAPVLVGLWGRLWRGWHVGAVLTLAMVSSIALQTVSMLGQESEMDLGRVERIVRGRRPTSYLEDAQSLVREGSTLRQLLASWPERMPSFVFHAREKPPLPVLYYWALLRSGLDEHQAARVGGWLIGVLATLAIPACYWLVTALMREREAAIVAACLLALCPSAVVFFPQFDQLYPAMVCALVACWAMALRTGRAWWAAAFGVVLGVMCLWAYNMLVMGAFLGVYGLLSARRRELVRLSVIGLAAFSVFNLALWAGLGYRPIDTFIAAVREQWTMQAGTPRHWPGTMPWDLADFLLGLGWLPALLGIFYVLRREAPNRVIAILCLLQPVLTAGTGLLRGETARVWMFMVPLALAPAAIELSRWRREEQMVALGCLWLIVLELTRNMRFLEALAA